MIIREDRRERFTIVSNAALEDSRLSFQAKGLLVYLLSKPDGWCVSREHLATVGPNGISSVRAILTELEQCGYLTRTRKAGEHGRFTWESVIHEHCVPSDEKPPMVNPPMEKPPVVNRTLVKTEVANTDTEHPLTPKGEECVEGDAWEPGYPDPMPVTTAPSRAKLNAEREKRRADAEVLILTFFNECHGVPLDTPLTPGVFDANKQAAYNLLAVNATPEKLRAAVRNQKASWPGQRGLTLAYIERDWLKLSATTPPHSSAAAAARVAPPVEMSPEQKAAMEAKIAEIAQARRTHKPQGAVH